MVVWHAVIQPAMIHTGYDFRAVLEDPAELLSRRDLALSDLNDRQRPFGVVPTSE